MLFKQFAIRNAEHNVNINRNEKRKGTHNDMECKQCVQLN